MYFRQGSRGVAGGELLERILSRIPEAQPGIVPLFCLEDTRGPLEMPNTLITFGLTVNRLGDGSLGWCLTQVLPWKLVDSEILGGSLPAVSTRNTLKHRLQNFPKNPRSQSDPNTFFKACCWNHMAQLFIFSVVFCLCCACT